MTELAKKRLCEIFEIDDLANKSRQLDYVFARMIFVKYFTDMNYSLEKVGGYINRDHSTAHYLRNKYQDEYDCNPYFRMKADKFYGEALFDSAEKETETLF